MDTKNIDGCLGLGSLYICFLLLIGEFCVSAELSSTILFMV